MVCAGLWLGAVASLGMVDRSLGCGDHCHGNPLDVGFSRAFTNDDAQVDDPNRDAGDHGLDPGNGKPVGECRASVDSSDTVRVTIQNAYPGYRCRVWVKVRNLGCRDVRRASVSISAPAALAVTEVSPARCYVLKPGDQKYEVYDVRVLQAAREGTTYRFVIRTTFMEALQGCHGCR
jgi:hypothetical protein